MQQCQPLVSEDLYLVPQGCFTGIAVQFATESCPFQGSFSGMLASGELCDAQEM